MGIKALKSKLLQFSEVHLNKMGINLGKYFPIILGNHAHLCLFLTIYSYHDNYTIIPSQLYTVSMIIIQ